MENCIIRLADLEDLEELISLMTVFLCDQVQYNPRYVNMDIDSHKYISLKIKDNTVLVAEVDQKIIGFLIFAFKHVEERIIFIKEIFVKEEFQRHSIGRCLVEECCKIGQTNNYCEILLNVLPSNEKAKKFYFDLCFAVDMLTLRRSLPP